jgi:hypothetical protein
MARFDQHSIKSHAVRLLYIDIARESSHADDRKARGALDGSQAPAQLGGPSRAKLK